MINFIDMNKIWFKKLGWFFRPVSWHGWLVVVVALIFSVQVFVAVDRHSHSVSDTFYGVFPFIVPTFLLLLWIASNTSDKQKKD